MTVGIVGAGFTGLAAGFRLAKNGHKVQIFERDPQPGGLAIGYKEKEWDWTLEKHYHHWFTNDDSVLSLAREINHKVYIKRPHTNWFVDGKIYEFDSIKAALFFPKLPIVDKLRNLATLGFFRFLPLWQPLEKYKATKMLPKMMGKSAYQMLWDPLFQNKFGGYKDEVSLAWFWARIHKRTQSLAYPEGGFLHFAQKLVSEIEKMGGKVHFSKGVEKIQSNGKVIMSIGGKKEEFDKVIVTLPSPLFLKIAPDLPHEYTTKLTKLNGLGATNLILRLKEPFFPDGTYWLSIADKNSPIMAIVEHTNFMDKKHYNNEHLVYLGNYLTQNDERFTRTKEELLKLYHPFLEKINPEYKKHIIDYQAFKAPFAQPIIPINYSEMLPPFKTPFENVYLFNIQQVYPWDRGTNYAVELGEKAASLI